jgi:hypothetical protein
MIEGEGVPKICAGCIHSHWEDWGMDYELPLCGKYDELCSDALKKCDLISLNKCEDCPRYV